MRPTRPKPRDNKTVFHCFSRTVAGQFLFGPPERETFCRLMRKHAAFCHMQILTHTVLSNHFHIVTRAPLRVVLTDAQLLAKLKAFYGPKSQQATEFQSACNGPKSRLEKVRRRYLARMGDVSVFMKELKQAFSRWYNRQHDRFGTLWAQRFGSELIEDRSQWLLIVAAYVDLNALRAGLVPDPKDYRWCGYAEAMAGNRLAREGLLSLLPPGASWKTLLAEYRKYLFLQAGCAGRSGKKQLSREEILKVLKKQGHLSVAERLRLRIRHFTDGAVLGSREYVEEMWRRYFRKYSPKRKSGARKLKGGDWGGLMTLRDLQKDVIG